MSALAKRKPVQLEGQTQPRIAPPVPARSGAKDYATLATKLGINLYPWQEYAARYLTAVGPDDRWLYREVAIIVARQNGKTTLLIPLIVQRLLDGQKIMHTAQNAKLPREIHEQVAALIGEHYPKALRPKRAISYALGHEEIRLANGGHYRIVAPTRGGARGPSNDVVIVDELREMEDHGFIGAAKPTLTHSAKPQMIYLSNAGTEKSEVLHALQARRSEDPALAYLEWSAEPNRKADDIAGWLEANPAYGHDPSIEITLVDEYRANSLTDQLSIFETEHLCRPVVSMRQRLVHPQAWADLEGELGKRTRPMMGVSMAPDGTRASAAVAWATGDKQISLQVVFDVTGDPIDTAALGQDMLREAARMGVGKVGFDPITDAELAKFFGTKKEPITGRNYQNASARFVTAVEGKELVWADADAVTADLPMTARKLHSDTNTFEAVRASDDVPITAALAAIRAVWLASGPRPTSPRIL